MIGTTKASKGSSYGKDKLPPKSCNGAYDRNEESLSSDKDPGHDKEPLSESELKKRIRAEEANTKNEQNL